MRVVGPGRYLLLHLALPALLAVAGVAFLLVAALDRVHPFLGGDRGFLLLGIGAASWFAGMLLGVLVNGERLVVVE